VLAAEPDDEPIDQTGNTFVQGNADYYAGGVTAARGTAKQAVRSQTARPDGVVGAPNTGTAAASGIDRSRNAAVVRRDWDCPFPPEAELEQVNAMAVTVAVVVSAQGAPLEAKPLSDPGFGFGRAAQRCAMRQPYSAALGRSGLPRASTINIIVNFVRQ
jgi:protein TonB